MDYMEFFKMFGNMRNLTEEEQIDFEKIRNKNSELIDINECKDRNENNKSQNHIDNKKE